MHLADNTIELVLIGKNLNDHGLVKHGVEEHAKGVPSEKEGIDKSYIFIGHLGNIYH